MISRFQISNSTDKVGSGDTGKEVKFALQKLF